MTTATPTREHEEPAAVHEEAIVSDRGVCRDDRDKRERPGASEDPSPDSGGAHGPPFEDEREQRTNEE